MTIKSELTQARLKHLLHYDPETGAWTWRNPNCARMLPGSPAGYIKEGYLMIRVDYVKYRAHRLAWLYVHGKWPKEEIDHINRRRGDNRLVNLRDVSRSVNMKNRVMPKRKAA